MNQSPWGAPPVAQRGGTVRALALGVALALALGVFAFGLTSYLTSAGPAPEPTASPSATQPEPATPLPTEPTPQPTPTTSDDDYNPPPLPRPRTFEEAEQWLKANAFYDRESSIADCAIRRISDPTPPALEVMDVHLNHTMDCLMLVWAEPMAAAGFILPRPPVRSYDQPITTACGTSPSMEMAAAFYCPGDQRVFYAIDRNRPLFYRTSLEIDNTMAHEFGHTLQGRTGIIPAETAMVTNTRTEEEALEYSRRTELQADCLGGMAMSALSQASGITAAERELLRQDTYSRGDREGYPRTHGTPDSGLNWVTIGLESRSVGRCNTYVADSADVA